MYFLRIYSQVVGQSSFFLCVFVFFFLLGGSRGFEEVLFLDVVVYYRQSVGTGYFRCLFCSVFVEQISRLDVGINESIFYFLGIVIIGFIMVEYNYYVSVYRVFYSDDGQRWIVYREFGVEQDKVKGLTKCFEKIF